MKIKFLGTAASEGVPALFCQCAICKNARERRGREIRTRCQALVDGELLLDFGPDTYMHILRDGIDITDVAYCLVTHAHSDHLYVDDIETRAAGFAILSPSTRPLTVMGGRGVKQAADRYGDGRITEEGNARFLLLHAFEPVSFDGFRVTPVPAVHSTEEPFVYIIERGGKTLFYAHDTDILPDETLDMICASGARFDLVSMDCNEGVKHIDYHGHMNVERDLVFMSKLRERGLADADTVFVANHFSHNGRLPYADAVKIGEEHGFLIAYDGMEIEF